MLDPDYYRSLSLELRALKNRVRSFIQDQHWLTDGEWKESVLRSMLKRNLPRTVEVGRGFVVSTKGRSKQIDVLLYDASKPVLFRDGDLAIVTPDAVRGVIEVKTGVDATGLEEALLRLSDHAALINSQSPGDKFYGLFAYENRTRDVLRVLQSVHDAVHGDGGRIVDCVCLGEGLLVRYWTLDPFEGKRQYDKWRAYDLPEEAQGYFLHNVVEGVSPQSVSANSSLWYPEQGKEARFVAEIAWREGHPV